MSLRELLGLEDTHFTDEEIMRLLEKGLRSHHLNVALDENNHHVVLHLHEIDPTAANYSSLFHQV
ncbi:hypothetical protein HYV86_02360 [Candidatus Woesearchaeota archaeon]|nr:hypothetical protein [Candidatus Woesearchaeota archaeon]